MIKWVYYKKKYGGVEGPSHIEMEFHLWRNIPRQVMLTVPKLAYVLGMNNIVNFTFFYKFNTESGSLNTHCN